MSGLIAITTIITTIAGTLASVKWLFPLVGKAYKYFADKGYNDDKQNLTLNKEVIEFKENSNELYQNQITFFVKQCDILQSQLIQKQTEIDILNKAINSLRSQLLTVQSQLDDNNKKIDELHNYSCSVANCQMRKRIININKINKHK